MMLRFVPGFIVLVPLLLLSAPAAAQDVVVQAQTNASLAGEEDVITLSVRVQGASLEGVDTPSPPQTTGLALTRSVPSTNRSMEAINGRVQSSVTFHWQYRPVRTGTVRIDPVEVRVGSATYHTEPIEVEVVPQSQLPGRREAPPASPDAPRSEGAAQDDGSDAVVSEDELFIRTDVSTRHAYPNEPVVVTYRLFFDSGITLRRSRLSGGWDTPGFWREDLNVPQRPVPDFVEESGRSYHSFVLKRSVVFPTRTGTLEIAPFRIETTAERSPGRRHRLDSFFSQDNHEERIQVASEPVSIQVASLPAGAPDAFRGAVGSYELTSELNRSALTAGEGTELSIRIRGRGNLATLDPPRLDLPAGLSAYGPEIDTSFDRDGGELRGERTFRFTLVPETEGTYEVPPVRFAFFDPSLERFERRATDPVTLHVSEAPAESPLSVSEAESPSAVTPSQPTRSPWIYASLLAVLAAIGLAAFFFLRRQRATEEQSAPKRAGRPTLRRARAHLSGQTSAFGDALERAINAFLTERLGIGARNLPRERLEASLTDAGVPPPKRKELLRLLDACDRIRFAPTTIDRREREALLHCTEALLSSLRDA